MHSLVPGYSQLLVKAASILPGKYGFASGGLRVKQRDIRDWADSRLFNNPAFRESNYGPDNWPSELKVASAQAVTLMMGAINIEKTSRSGDKGVPKFPLQDGEANMKTHSSAIIESFGIGRSSHRHHYQPRR